MPKLFGLVVLVFRSAGVCSCFELFAITFQCRWNDSYRVLRLFRVCWHKAWQPGKYSKDKNRNDNAG